MGTLTSLVILFKDFVELSSGHETLTISAPFSSKLRICFTVAETSVVNVFVIDCTLIGESPPIDTFPTLIVLVFFLIIFLYGLISILI